MPYLIYSGPDVVGYTDLPLGSNPFVTYTDPIYLAFLLRAQLKSETAINLTVYSATVTISGNTYQLSQGGLALINSSIIDAVSNNTLTVTLALADGTLIVMSVPDAKSLLVTIQAYLDGVQANYQSLNAAITAATNYAQLLLINVNAGWPTPGTPAAGIWPLSNGQLYIGSTGTAPVVSTISAGSGIGVTNAAGSITISTTGLSGFSWQNVATSSQTMIANTGYITNNGASLVTYTLPITATQGTQMSISGFSSGGWTVHQNASQQIFLGSQNTTAGITGSLSSTQAKNQISLLCVVANTTWVVLNAIGNLTYV